MAQRDKVPSDVIARKNKILLVQTQIDNLNLTMIKYHQIFDCGTLKDNIDT